VRSIGTFALIFLLCPIGFCQAPSANSPKGDQEVPTLQRESPALIPAPPTEAQPSQSPANPSLQYAPRAILLLSGEKDVEGVMPMVMTINGQSQLQFVPASRIKEFMDHGAQPIHLGDVLSALGEATETINRLTAENERLWKVAMKDAPPQQPTTVVVQQPAPQRPSALEKYLLLRSLLPAQPQPYRPVQIQPYPVINPNANRLQTDCTSQNLAGTTYTNCH
jgi:hypothetical protein